MFYNRILKCFVLIDLKIGDIKHQDLGQMQMYVNYYDRNVKLAEENNTVGIILCKDKSETEQSDKASFMMDYLSPNFNDEQKEMARIIVGHLFEKKSNQDLSAKSKEGGFFSLSPTVDELVKKLSDDLKKAIVSAFNDGMTSE